MKIPSATQRKRGRFGSNLSASKQSVSALQEEVSKVVDKSLSLKDTELKELDDEDHANIKRSTVAKDLVEKSQRRRGRKGSTSKTNDEDTLQKLRKSKIKQHDNLKAQDDTTMEPVVKVLSSTNNLDYCRISYVRLSNNYSRAVCIIVLRTGITLTNLSFFPYVILFLF